MVVAGGSLTTPPMSTSDVVTLVVIGAILVALMIGIVRSGRRGTK